MARGHVFCISSIPAEQYVWQQVCGEAGAPRPAVPQTPSWADVARGEQEGSLGIPAPCSLPWGGHWCGSASGEPWGSRGAAGGPWGWWMWAEILASSRGGGPALRPWSRGAAWLEGWASPPRCRAPWQAERSPPAPGQHTGGRGGRPALRPHQHGGSPASSSPLCRSSPAGLRQPRLGGACAPSSEPDRLHGEGFPAPSLSPPQPILPSTGWGTVLVPTGGVPSPAPCAPRRTPVHRGPRGASAGDPGRRVGCSCWQGCRGGAGGAVNSCPRGADAFSSSAAGRARHKAKAALAPGPSPR